MARHDRKTVRKASTNKYAKRRRHRRRGAGRGRTPRSEARPSYKLLEQIYDFSPSESTDDATASRLMGLAKQR
jgi:hypothetical protein